MDICIKTESPKAKFLQFAIRHKLTVFGPKCTNMPSKLAFLVDFFYKEENRN